MFVQDGKVHKKKPGWDVEHIRVPLICGCTDHIGLKCWNILTKLGEKVDFSIAESVAWFVFDGAIWASAARQYNAKTGPDRARVHLESSNLVCRHGFSSPEKWHGLFFDSAIC